MATVNINTGPMVDDLGLIVNVQSARPPFNVGIGIHAKTYKVGTDFTSGDNVVFNVKASPAIRFASFAGPNGAIKTYTKGALSPIGTSFTLAAVTTDIQALIIFDT